MKIIITEKHFKTVLKNFDTINEQDESINDEKTLIVLQNRINDIIDKKQKEILDKTSVKVTTQNGQVNLQIGEKVYPMKPMVKGIYALIIPPKNTLTFGGAAMKELLPEIEKINEYKILAGKYPELKSEIERGVVSGTIFTDEQNQGTFKLTVTTRPLDMTDSKSAVKFGTDYPLGEFLERNKIIYKFSNGNFGTLESGQIQMNLASIQLKLNTQATPTTRETPIAQVTIRPMIIGDIFNFDTVDFKDESTAQQQYGAFIQQIKGYIQQYGEPFIAHMRSQNPTIYGYASIDGDPTQPVTGGYQPCMGNKTRRDYDLCLSSERAKKIADILNSSIKELGGIFKFKGMGETTKWGPGWTAENPTIPEQTAPNRRYIMSQIAPYIAKQAPPQQ